MTEYERYLVNLIKEELLPAYIMYCKIIDKQPVEVKLEKANNKIPALLKKKETV